MNSFGIDWRNPQLSTDLLTRAAREALPVDSHFPFTLNAYSMVHYAPLINTLVSNLKIRRIVEVGVLDGDFSLYLLGLTQRLGAAVDFVDIDFTHEAQTRIGSATPTGVTVALHAHPSSTALRNIDPIDLVFLDGDHNWETASAELALIAESPGKRVIVIHDVGWPCGRRDTAYDANRLSDKEDYCMGQLTPFSDGIVSEFGLPFPKAKRREGGPRNGVLAAVETFRASGNDDWSYWSIPIFFGVGVLWSSKFVSPDEHAHLVSVGESYKSALPLLAAAELNRLMMLIRLQNNGEVWKNMKARIDTLEDKLAQNNSDTKMRKY